MTENNRPHFSYNHPAHTPECTTVGREPDDSHRHYNYEICQAIDMTKLNSVLAEMVEKEWMDKRMAELFHQQASTLLALITSENNRIFHEAAR